ncbi:sensor histidine kinase [Aureimonas sp. N4]|uniref:sensor histidine kinase n=1 Tax=Aureimonas sp. N4 TaxID=1638165 RepID=UPI0007828013|nr:ATP-binding protein [Aureimonas sp. N4]
MRLVTLAGGFALLVVAWLAAGEIGRRSADSQLADRSESALAAAASVLRSEIGKQRAVPSVLAEDPEVLAVLREPTKPMLERVNRRLDGLAATTGASVIYLVARTGLAIASSNYADPQSFIGNDYRFRRYFSESITGGQAEQYALGSVSRRPGLYIARRVGSAEAPLGVVVLKMELDAVEETWRAGGNIVFATDEPGVILATTRPDWRFHTLQPLPPQKRYAIRETLQFGEAPLTPLSELTLNGGTQGRLASGPNRGIPVFVSERPLGDPSLNWRLYLLLPSEDVLDEAQRSSRLVGFAIVLAVVGPGIALQRRRRRSHQRQADLRATAAELERRVAERTAEIADTNRRLRDAMDARECADQRAGELREELDQAARLATLGQIAAGVAHEINQPLTAIRTYGENAGLFLERGDTQRTADNLKLVVGLTDRIGSITGALRNFSRRGSQPLGPVSLREAADGAQMLLHNRFSVVSADLVREGDAWDLSVLGEPIRLEQVLVNLLQNALDAVAETEGARIVLAAWRDGEEVALSVGDNGPGIDPSVLPRLFIPFSTAKPRGLGLGLVISRDILAEWGGELSATSEPGRGATFTARLRWVHETGNTA